MREDRRKVAKFLIDKGVDLEPIKKKKVLAEKRRKVEILKSQGKSIRESFLDLDLDFQDTDSTRTD